MLVYAEKRLSDDFITDGLDGINISDFRVSSLRLLLPHYALIKIASFFEEVALRVSLSRNYREHFHYSLWDEDWYGIYSDLVIYPTDGSIKIPDYAYADVQVLLDDEKNEDNTADQDALLTNPKEISVVLSISELSRMSDALRSICNELEQGGAAAFFAAETISSGSPELTVELIEDDAFDDNQICSSRMMVWASDIVLEKEKNIIDSLLLGAKEKFLLFQNSDSLAEIMPKRDAASLIPAKGTDYFCNLPYDSPLVVHVADLSPEGFVDDCCVAVVVPDGWMADTEKLASTSMPWIFRRPLILPCRLWEEGYFTEADRPRRELVDRNAIGLISVLDITRKYYYFLNLDGYPIDFEPQFIGINRVENIESLSLWLYLASLFYGQDGDVSTVL